MSTILSKPTETESSSNMPRLPWYLKDLHIYIGGFALLIAIYIGLRMYQGANAVATGLDSTLPEYAIYWMRLFYGEVIALLSFMGCLWTYLWTTRDRELDKIVTIQRIYFMYFNKLPDLLNFTEKQKSLFINTL